MNFCFVTKDTKVKEKSLFIRILLINRNAQN